MSELLIQYQTFAQNKQLCYSQKRGGLNFPQRFWSVTMETRILYRLIMFFPALDKSPLAGFTEAKYDISDRLEGKIFRIWLRIPKTLAKFKWDGKWGPMKSAIFTKMAPEFDKKKTVLLETGTTPVKIAALLFVMQLHSSLHDCDVKFPFGLFYGGRKHTRTNFSFSF